MNKIIGSLVGLAILATVAVVVANQTGILKKLPFIGGQD